MWLLFGILWLANNTGEKTHKNTMNETIKLETTRNLEFVKQTLGVRTCERGCFTSMYTLLVIIKKVQTCC